MKLFEASDVLLEFLNTKWTVYMLALMCVPDL